MVSMRRRFADESSEHEANRYGGADGPAERRAFSAAERRAFSAAFSVAERHAFSAAESGAVSLSERVRSRRRVERGRRRVR